MNKLSTTQLLQHISQDSVICCRLEGVGVGGWSVDVRMIHRRALGHWQAGSTSRRLSVTVTVTVTNAEGARHPRA